MTEPVEAGSSTAGAAEPVAGVVGPAPRDQARRRDILAFLRQYAVLVLFVAVFIWLSLASDAFLSVANLMNILNQNAPLAIVATAGTLVIIAGGFDLSTGSIYGVASIVAALIAVHVNPLLGLASAPLVGAALGLANGLIITALKVHSFLATLASSLVYRGAALLLSGGFFIAVGSEGGFTALGRDKIGPVNFAVLVFLAWALAIWIVLNHTRLGRYIFAVGGNEEAAVLSGIRTGQVKVWTFVLSGIAAGIAGAITVSRISSGQPQAGEGVELQAIAAIILGGTSIYGGWGAVWRSIVGVYLLALIGNGFNILNANPFYKDLTTGLIIVLAVALSAARRPR
jgi:ribose transport system permease protein